MMRFALGPVRRGTEERVDGPSISLHDLGADGG